jgi:hypothetical protein
MRFKLVALTAFLFLVNFSASAQDVYVGTDISNSWAIHAPNDGRKSLFIHPGLFGNNWDWTKGFTISNNGELTLFGSGAASFIGTTPRLILGGASNPDRHDIGALEFKDQTTTLLWSIMRRPNGFGFDNSLLFSFYDGTNWTANTEFLRNGNAIFYNSVGIGTTNPGSFRLAVEGKLGAREIVVQNTPWADFVFNADYKLRSLDEVASFINTHKHLPDMPTEAEIKEHGMNVGETQAKLLQKIEELTLYMIDLKKENEGLKKRVTELEK